MTQHQHELTSFLITLRQIQNLQNLLSNTNINYFPYVHSHLGNLFTLMFMLQFLEYAEDMNSQVFAELPTSTVVSDTSLVVETLLVELHLGANVSETWQHFISLTFWSLNKAFERCPVRSLINFSSRPALNNVEAHVTQRLWLLFGLKPAYQTLSLPLFEYSISPFIFVLSQGRI